MTTTMEERVAHEEHVRKERAMWENHATAIFQGLLWSVLVITAAISGVVYVVYRMMA